MPDSLAWLVPALIVLTLAALAAGAVVWAVRRARRSPKARAAADAARARAETALIRLDDAVGELDLEAGLSGALHSGHAPASLRRARMTAHHVRDASFIEYGTIASASPDEARRIARRIENRATGALEIVTSARADHATWMRTHVSAAAQIAAARDRLADLLSMMGDSTALVADLSARFTEEEWALAARAARSANDAAAEAGRHLDAANANAPSALPALAAAERALRAAENETRVLEEAHRLVTQAALALPGEFAGARAALRSASTTLPRLDPDEAARVSTELSAVDAALTDLETAAAHRPTQTVDAIARLRTRIDLALGDACSAQQRLRGARTALPGTLAAARSALGAAEASLTHARTGVEARARLLSAQAELANARQSNDPVAALEAARRAMCDADDAKALADDGRLASR